MRFVRSALTVFASEISLHARGQCSAFHQGAFHHGASHHGASHHGATNRRPFLPLPDGMPTSEDDWT